MLRFPDTNGECMITRIAERANIAARAMATLSERKRNAALTAIADALVTNAERIEAANAADLASAHDLAAPLQKRLAFGREKVADAARGVLALRGLADPVGRVLSRRELDKGLLLEQVSCPIGVTGVIFESRPDALVQISTLCLKSGNAALLKGGSEAMRTNRIVADIIIAATAKAGMPEGWMALLETRADVAEMLKLDDLIDLVIPRGSNAFVRHIMDTSRIPVMGHADGICHVYVDAKADVSMALDITVDSKTQYVAVCNAAETLLVHKAIAKKFLPTLKERFEGKVELRGCERTRAIIACAPATEEDWKTEYLDTILSIKIVDSLDDAIAHINCYGSRHTDAIVTSNVKAAETFMERVDSADVFWNASTRFADGYRFGLGAEVGISTSKIHARGPVGLEGLLIYKWKLRGKGHVVKDYAEGRKTFRWV